MENSEPSEEQGEAERNKAPRPQPSPPQPDPKSSRSEGKPADKVFYWVIAVAALFFLYLFYSVFTHNTVNIHGH